MDKLLTAGQSISILDQLRRKVKELGDREKLLIESRDRELKSIQRKCGLENARFKQQAEAETQKAMEALEEERVRLENRFAVRKVRIEQAFEKTKANLLEIAEQTRSQQKYENQKELLHANRVHDTDVQSLDRARKSYLVELSNETNRLEDIGAAGWKVFKGYGTFRKYLQNEEQASFDNVSNNDANALLESLRSQLNDLESQLSFSIQNALSRFFSAVSIWAILVCVGIGAAVAFLAPQVSDVVGISPDRILAGVCVTGGLVVIAYGVGYLMARGTVRSFVELFMRSTDLIQQCQLAADQTYDQGVSSAQDNIQTIEERLESALKHTDATATEQYNRGLSKLSGQLKRLLTRNEAMATAALESLTDSKSLNLGEGNSPLCEGLKKIEADQEDLQIELTRRFNREIEEITSEWSRFIPDWLSDLNASWAAQRQVEQTMDSASSQEWVAPLAGDPSGCFGQLVLDWTQFLESIPTDSGITLPADEILRVPLVFKMPLGESALFESDGPAPQEMMEAINHTALQLLVTSPIGRMRFTLIDPVGLGKNFAGLMHLADYDEQLINRRIWTQSNQIEQCLRDLTEHMEKVTQMYLRNEYDTLADYNKAAGNIAEKYHVLVISDFPNGFSESALRRLQNIAVGGRVVAFS